MKFQTQYERKQASPELNSGKRLIEKAGYIPAQKRIENLMLAGKRLVEGRKEQYDFDGEIDENFTDPTRNRGLDMAEAFQLQEHARRNIKSREEMLKTSQKQQEALGKASDSQTVPE